MEKKELKIKDIRIYRDDEELISTKNNAKWLSISKNLIYLSWQEGRIYFFPKDINKEGEKGIKNFVFDDGSQSMDFNWIGTWEDESDGNFRMYDVNYAFKIVFNKSKDFDNVKEIINSF